MSLNQWHENTWIQEVVPSKSGLQNMLNIADREISDAKLPQISVDGKFAHSYDALRSLCEAALYASGFIVPKGGRKHERSIQSLEFTLDGSFSEQIDYFDRCRRLRHKTVYERTGVIGQGEADILLKRTESLKQGLLEWLEKYHSKLL